MLQAGKDKPLKECLIAASDKYGSDEVLKNWVILMYPVQSDYYTFRKTVSGGVLRIKDTLAVYYLPKKIYECLPYFTY